MITLVYFLDCEKELSYYELVFEEIIIGSKEPQKYQSVSKNETSSRMY